MQIPRYQGDLYVFRLCHIVHGPHDEKFHALWNQLRSEHETLVRKGYTGEGFLSTGYKLGGRRIPMHEARRRARATVEKRKVVSAGSEQKLGGAPIRRDIDIRKVIADAASRRITVTKGCASGTERSKSIVDETSRNGFLTKAEEDDANEVAIMQAYIELIQEEEREKYGDAYIPPSSANPSGSGWQHDPASASSSSAFKVNVPKSNRSTPNHSRPQTPPENGVIDLSLVDSSYASTPSNHWSCQVCTLVNPTSFLCCDACGTERASNTVPREQLSQSSLAPARSPSALTSSRPSDKATKRKETARTFSSLLAAERSKPIGWLCQNCSTFMENEWWTCSSCGQMKQSS